MARKSKEGQKEEDRLTLKEELFCTLMTKDRTTFDNQTLSYAFAYGYDLDTLKQNLADARATGKKRGIKAAEIEYKRTYNVCAAQGSILFKKPKIRRRIQELLASELDDFIMIDAELARVIKQDKKLDSKVAAIREANKLKQRVMDKPLTDPIKVDISVQLAKVYGQPSPDTVPANG